MKPDKCRIDYFGKESGVLWAAIVVMIPRPAVGAHKVSPRDTPVPSFRADVCIVRTSAVGAAFFGIYAFHAFAYSISCHADMQMRSYPSMNSPPGSALNRSTVHP